jgi:putative PEP-CTERM system histidine kinase
MNTANLFAFICALFGSALAFTVLWNERRSPVHLSFVLGMVVLVVESVLNGLSFQTDFKDAMYWQQWRLVTMSFLPGIWLFFSLTYGRGNYREFIRRWKFALLAAFLIPPATAIACFQSLVVIAEPPKPALMLETPGVALNLFLLAGAVLVIMNLERTFRSAVGIMRWRIKFMVLGLGVLFAVRAYTGVQAMLFHGINPSLQNVDCGALFAACALVLRSLFREGHFDLDVYPSHSVLQNSLTVVLAGIYLLIMGVFAKLVTIFGGDEWFTLKAFIVLAALVTLTMLLLSDRVRLQTSRFISRHFQRPLYDYRTVWRKFTEATATCVNQTELCQAAVKSVTDIFQAMSVTVWLVDDKKEQFIFAASTFLSEARAAELAPEKSVAALTINFLQQQREPVVFETNKEAWAAALRQCHPDEFKKGGHRICVPMIVGDEIVGLMLLGDRVGGVPFSWQDFDLLKCIGDEIAAGLLNTRLSQKLLQAKELEAFQTMSAFFVHDMKNMANTLNLMLQNLPVHFDDPEFRADALRGIGKTVANINRLVGRLGTIRSELQIRPATADLNEVVAKALAGWEEVAGINLEKNLSPLPELIFDPDQMLKVATNLIFNAREAVSKTGRVQIQTAQSNGWAILTVADDGCGMSSEFMNRQLFRAFQTTKKNGLGIGMFQSKMIVEAHKGRMEVESEPGKGTTFRVFLPLKN